MTETPDLSEVINAVVENRIIDLHTSMPAIIESFDASTGRISASPAIRKKDTTGSPVTLPIVNDIPVVYPQSVDSIFSFPLQIGDEVLLIFSERSLDSWKEVGGIVDPEDRRKFNLSDAFALPLGRTQTVDSDKMQIKHLNGIISIDSSGKFFIGNSNDELLDIISDLLDLLKTITTDVTGVTTTVTGTCPAGGGPLIAGAGTQNNTAVGNLITSIVSDIDTIKTRLGTIKQ